MISSFYQYHSGCVFYCSRIARKAEAGWGGILRSINRSATCPAMWRLTFSGGGRSVRLSANGCQPHRPNTALLFCAAGYHPGLLRTFREHDLNCNMPILLRDMFHKFYPGHSLVTSELRSDRLLLRNLDPFPEYPRSVPVCNFFAFLQESIE